MGSELTAAGFDRSLLMAVGLALCAGLSIGLALFDLATRVERRKAERRQVVRGSVLDRRTGLVRGEWPAIWR